MGKLGEEVSQKIKSAIKAKLTELGIRMDNELPDYVMVLVANKKSQKQMEQDLNLFLGPSTTAFTMWLHNVLKKLEQVTVSSKGQRKKTEEKVKLKSKRHSTEEKEDEVPNSKKSKDSSERSVLKREPIVAVEETLEPKTDPSKCEIDTEDEDEYLNLRADLDADGFSESRELTNESSNPSAEEKPEIIIQEPAPEVPKVEKSVEVPRVFADNKRKSPPRERVKIIWDEGKSREARSIRESREEEDSGTRGRSRPRGEKTSKEKAPSTTRKVSSLERPQEPQAEKKVSDAREILNQKASKKPGEVQQPSREEEVEKRKKQLSSVSKLVSHQEKERVESVSVASMVKVTPRPIRRAGIQANKNLILKAVADAEKSISASVRKTRKPEPLPKIKRSAKEDFLEYIPPAKISITLPNDRVPSGREEVLPPVESQDEEVTRLVKDNKIEEPMESEELLYSDSSLRLNPTNNVVESKEEEAMNSTPPIEVEKFEGNPLIEPKSIRSGRLGARTILGDCNSEGIKEPQFLITLGSQMTEMFKEVEMEFEDELVLDRLGVGEEELELGDDEGEVESKAASLFHGKLPFNRNRLGPPTLIPTARKLPNIEVSIENSIEKLAEVSALQDKLSAPLKMMKRCIYWPKCHAGESCLYHHPQAPCKMFPECSYGEKCIYVHPPCRYGANCYSTKCPYSHLKTAPVAVKFKAPLPLSIPSTEQCKYYPNCKNRACRYQHPKRLCKFGLQCTNWGCEFEHPKSMIPSKDQLKWTSKC